MSRLVTLYILLLTVLTAQASHAATLRVYVAEINAVGVQNRDEMKATLQTLLASRLNSERIVAVGSAAEADALVTGTYVTIGKIFSLDAIAKSTGGKVLTRSFIQGENQDELIPSVGKLADKLAAELVAVFSASPARTASAPVAPAFAAVPATGGPQAAFIKNEQPAVRAPGGDFIKPQDTVQSGIGGWLSKRLDGAANLLAVGKTLPDGSREIFLAEERRVSYYRQGSDMKLVAEKVLGDGHKIISLDTSDGKDGSLDIYVTIIRGDDPASQVWQVKGDKLTVVAENLPWFFRSFNLAGGPKKLYAQAMGRDVEFFGDVFEASRNGSDITTKNPLKMPRYGTIYTFNQVRGQDGNTLTLVVNPDGYLIAYDQQLKELWRSNDKFGGSELYFLRSDDTTMRISGERFRWIFMNQRIHVTAAGDVLVGKNDGFWVLGNARSYKKGAVYCLTWNGSSLEEKWHTRDTQNYMPDYFLDEGRNELMILQTVQRSGISARGASSLTIRKVE